MRPDSAPVQACVDVCNHGAWETVSNGQLTSSGDGDRHGAAESQQYQCTRLCNVRRCVRLRPSAGQKASMGARGLLLQNVTDHIGDPVGIEQQVEQVQESDSVVFPLRVRKARVRK